MDRTGGRRKFLDTIEAQSIDRKICRLLHRPIAQ